MVVRELLNKIGSKVANVLIGIGDFFVEMEKQERERMETPTPCKRCSEVRIRKELLPTRIWHFDYSLSDKYKQIIHAKAGYSSHRYCSTCWKLILWEAKEEYKVIHLYPIEARRVESHNERARIKGLEATLTTSQWVKTLDGFDWRCAYCPDGSFDHLEHIIPISRGGGTTVENCVPACKSCNSSKGVRLPEEIKESSRSPEAHRRVAARMLELHGNLTTTDTDHPIVSP